jgi:hypothetical protein
MQPLLGPNSLLLAQTSAQPKLRESRALVYDAWGPPLIHPRLTSPAYLGRADRRPYLAAPPSSLALSVTGARDRDARGSPLPCAGSAMWTRGGQGHLPPHGLGCGAVLLQPGFVGLRHLKLPLPVTARTPWGWLQPPPRFSLLDA